MPAPLVDVDGPTEPFDPPPAPAEVPHPAPPPSKTTDRDPEPDIAPFGRTRFHFMSGIPSGEMAHVRGDGGDVLLSYRSFASAVGIVAALVTAIVVISGLAATTFLLVEHRLAAGILALMLSAAFAVVIAMLVPPTKVTLFNGNHPAVTIAQQSNLSFPVATYVIASPDGRTLARIRRGVFSRMGRNRWDILSASDDRPIGSATEESLGRAFARKIAGKFNSQYEANLHIRYLGRDAGSIIRRPNAAHEADILDVSLDPEAALDRRVAVALATLVFGAEP